MQTVIFAVFWLTSCAVIHPVSDSSEEVKQAQEVQVQDFITNNFSEMRSDMAVGNGKKLTGLAELLALKEEDKQRFYALTEADFNRLFVSPETTGEQLLINLRREMLMGNFSN
ncbi:MAG: DUF3015 family protein [Gammaproteobacteria bacterium]|nr:DUF3015 family protein [Gammaproteobacteria bacterium]MBT5223146.1 DUF3015 family protein [Gammaproteobacteria bacterium]MBT5825021.1 DUF3015 family protein [Gammaproteobacteria bacterium]MBT5967077.1 DUF3015 family protein [Gammaproteobacteria bacterium]MBT6419402.1 DUF3015 family protein [Gammaproteobacteria bacterium]